MSEEFAKIKKAEPFDLAKGVDYQDGGVVSKTLAEKKTGNLTLFSFDVGQGLSEHTSPFDATVHVLEGEAEITIGGAQVTVKSGSMIIMPAGIPHSLRAEKRFKMLLIMIR